MKKESLHNQIKLYEAKYINFMGIDKIPEYVLETKEVSLEKADHQGFESVASALYDPTNDKHKLTVSTNLLLCQYFIYHEFTHMLDSELFAKNDKVKYAGITGYSEYHASQVELMNMLGANNINDKITFSMDTIISTFGGDKTVAEYVDMKYEHTISMFSRKDFPANIESLKVAIGALYNYFGLRSICEMYATDYTEKIDNSAFLKHIPTNLFSMLNRLMHGWFDKDKIELSEKVYIGIVFPLIKEHKLA